MANKPGSKRSSAGRYVWFNAHDMRRIACKYHSKSVVTREEVDAVPSEYIESLAMQFVIGLAIPTQQVQITTPQPQVEVTPIESIEPEPVAATSRKSGGIRKVNFDEF